MRPIAQVERPSFSEDAASPAEGKNYWVRTGVIVVMKAREYNSAKASDRASVFP
jgi:hypothetical protein